MRRALIGAGGYTHDIAGLMYPTVKFVENQYFTKNNEDVYPLREFDPKEFMVLVAIGDVQTRARIVASLPEGTIFFTHKHKSAQILAVELELADDGRYIQAIGYGCFIGANCVLMPNCKVGDHCLLNIGVIIGHDCKLGNFVTVGPSAGVMGDCVIGDRVYIGANAFIREKVKVCNDVVIGMNAGVVSDITEKGTYVGTPAKRIR